MSSNIPWFKLAVIGTFIGVSALIGYAVTSKSFTKAFESESCQIEPIISKNTLFYLICTFIIYSFFNLEDDETVSTEKNNKKLKLKKKKKTVTKSSNSNFNKKSEASKSISDPFEAALELIEMDANLLNKLEPELKQQVFYLLLVRGETLIKEKGNGSVEKAVEYFVKAVALVSQPAQVLMSYEQTLPADVFKKIIAELQDQNLDKTRAYFSTLAPETGLVRFEECEGLKSTSPTANANIKQWALLATSELAEGTVLMSEEPDVAMSTLSDHCDFCFKSLESLEPEYLADLSYCSKFCLTKARETYGKHLEDLKGTPAYAYQQLVKVVNETKCYAPILMLRYIAALLEDELSRQKQDDTSQSITANEIQLFAHYDYLRPAYRVPRDSDKAEAVLIRTILEPSHADIAQFLSDEIYVAMKSTVMFNAIGFKEVVAAVEAEEAQFAQESQISVSQQDESNKSSDEAVAVLKVLEPVRFSGSTSNSDLFGLYHSFAHISHSCDPNCQLISDSSIPRRLKLVAKRAIKSGERVTISFAEDKKIVERDFYINCECIKCTA